MQSSFVPGKNRGLHVLVSCGNLVWVALKEGDKVIKQFIRHFPEGGSSIFNNGI